MDLKRLNKVLNLVESKLNEEDNKAQYDSTNEQWAIKEFQKLFTSNGLQAPSIGKIEIGKWNEINYSAKLNGVAGMLFSEIGITIEFGGFVVPNGPNKNKSAVSFIIKFKWKYLNYGSNGNTLRYDYNITDKKEME